MQCIASGKLKAQKNAKNAGSLQEMEVDTKRHEEKQKGEAGREMRK